MNFLSTAFAVLALSLPSTANQPAESGNEPEPIELSKGARIVLIGNGLGSRMLHFGHFESGLHLQFPGHELFIRNMCDEGNTPSFRAHSGRANQLGFPDAEAFTETYTGGRLARGAGHFETEEEWLTRLQPDVIIAFFGFNESFEGHSGLKNFEGELDAFLQHTIQQKYNGTSTAELVLVSPTAFENRSDVMSVPDGTLENANLAAYTAVMETVARENDVRFVNTFNPSLEWQTSSRKPLTVDGALLGDNGYELLSAHLIENIFGTTETKPTEFEELVADAVDEKNWFWINDFKIPNGVHVFGRRFNPFGPDNYPFEVDKIRAMTAIRDEAIWAAANGRTLDLAARDAATTTLPAVETNYRPGGKDEIPSFLSGADALATIEVPDGYMIEQWATEEEFPDLANPVQMSFDNAGRLWVATMPSYPHYRPGDPRPNDKLLILEDTDGDGRADKQTVFADKLHLPMGFEFAPEGVYLSQGINLVLLKDNDGDDHADEREIILSGFDDHDTHHAIGAYCADPSGAILMSEGTFLRTSVETAYGPIRGYDGGFFRFSPQRRHLERHAQLPIPNPWGIAFDDWGQHFFLHTSGPTTEWMLPGSIKPRYGVSTPGSQDLIEPDHRVRPTAGLEFLSSRHFPDEVQGDMLLNNTIGFLGTKQHRVSDDGTGYKTKWRQDLTKSSDSNYRPVDLEVAPDGSLYIVDWHNPLIGHMQHNARDPLRDHDHGRIYRITYPGRALVEPAKILGASVDVLLENLKLPEYRSRYRTRRELRGRNPDEVLPALASWINTLDVNDAGLEHHLVEALWVTWGFDRVDDTLLRRLLASTDFRARAAAVRVLRYSAHRIPDQVELLLQAARDPHGRVKLEAIAAASWQEREDGLAILAEAEFDPQAEAEEPKPEYVKILEGGRMLEIAHPAIQNGLISSFRMTVIAEQAMINLNEMVITSGGKNVTALATLSQSSDYGDGVHPIEDLVDGNTENFSHTKNEANPWIEVRFEEPIGIDLIKIWNRPGFEDRFDPVEAVFRGEEEELLKLNFSIAADRKGIYADEWLGNAFGAAKAHLNDQSVEQEIVVEVPEHIGGEDRDRYVMGAEIYARDGHCMTCHQPDGLGLKAAGFPPLARTSWATGDEDRLIKLTLKGLLGPMEVEGESYPGLVPMTPFEALLDDNEIAAVLTYVRNSFGNRASVITPEKVAEVRALTQSKTGFYSPEELEGGASSQGRAFVKMWQMSDFAGAFDEPLRNRSFDHGREMFEAASCLGCHNIQGEGKNFGADLSHVADDYAPSELLRQILEPSKTIKAQHRLYRIELKDESLYVGLVVERGYKTLRVAESLQEPDTTILLQVSDIVTIEPLDISPMPESLLVLLTREQILDLLAFVMSNGDEQHAAFGD
ncbi:MAG: putative heme-binding domain-containing protein [Planctomycetota bacterium]|jgi:putative heme-binding domain-containing protein